MPVCACAAVAAIVNSAKPSRAGRCISYPPLIGTSRLAWGGQGQSATQWGAFQTENLLLAYFGPRQLEDHPPPRPVGVRGGHAPPNWSRRWAASDGAYDILRS